MFHVIDKEMQWRSDNGKSQGFESMRKFKPLVAVGAEEPLADQLMMADYFRKPFGARTWRAHANPPCVQRWKGWAGWRPHYRSRSHSSHYAFPMYECD